jgi:hypothetical protein
MNLRATFTFLILALFPYLAFGQTFSTPVQVSTHAGAHSPVLHVDRSGAIDVTWFENNADIYFSRSTDGGTDFLPPVRVSRQITTNNYTSLLQRAPEFAFDTKGNIHLVWMEARVKTPVTNQEQTDIWCVRSTDNGASWTQPLSIMDADDSDKYAQDFPAIACDSSNNLYVSYLDNRYLERGLIDHYKMQLERSTDGGATWSLPVIADKLPFENSGTCECCRQDIAVSPEGHVYIAFRTNMTESNGEKRDIFICRSTNSGITFDSSIRVQLGDWTLTACPTKGPHISLDSGENLHVAWSDARDDSGKLVSYYSMLRKGDTSIFPNYSVSLSASQSGNWPDLAVSSNGIIAYAYENNMPNLFSYSSDGGNTWHRNIAFPGASSDDQQLPILDFSSNGELYSVWEDGDANGILFSAISGLQSPQKSGAIVTINQPSYPIRAPIRLAWTKPGLMKGAQFVWYLISFDGLPNQYQTRDTSLFFDSLPAGQYVFRVKAYSSLGQIGSDSGIFNVGASASVGGSALPASGVFPNPATNRLVTISLPDLADGTVHVDIVNEKGNIVKTLQVRAVNGNLVLDLNGLLSGTYHASIVSGNVTFNEAITIP